VVTEPYFSAQHIDQQRALREMIEKEFGNEQRVRYVDLGPVLNPSDQMFTLDGFHLNAAGNEIIAEKLIPIIQESVRQSE
jgi:lysophospholipase L1-like esterase